MTLPAHRELENLIRSALTLGRLDDDLRRRMRLAMAAATPARRLEAMRLAFRAAGDLAGPDGRRILGTLESVVAESSGLNRESGDRLPEAHFSPGHSGRKRIIELIGGVQRTLEICVFAITDDDISRAVLDAHARDGVSVRIITDDVKSGDEGSDVGRFRKAGIPLLTDCSEAHMHHKFAVLDGRILIAGSYNWTRSAAVRNQDDVIVLREPGLVDAFAARFEHLWKALG